MRSSLETSSARGHNFQGINLWRWLYKYVSFTYSHYIFMMLGPVLVFVAMTVWLVLGPGVAPGGNTNYYRWNGHEITNRWDAYVGAGKENYGSLLSLLGSTLAMPNQFQLTQMGCIVSERTGKTELESNVLSNLTMRDIWKMEKEMRAVPGFEKYCFKVPLDGLPAFLQTFIRQLIESMKDILASMEEDTHCISFKSVFTELHDYMADPTILNMTNPGPDSLTDAIIQRFFTEDKERQKRLVATFVGNDFRENVPTPGSPLTIWSTRIRAMFPFALPIEGYRNKGDRELEQTAIMGKWQRDFLRPIKKYQKEKPHGFSPYGGFPFALNYDIAEVILSQVWWLVGSFTFLIVFAVLVMRNCFVSLLGVAGVFFPIPCALLLLNLIGIEYVDAIFVIALFLICGIGADCLFIVFELFRQSRGLYEDKRMRLAYATQRGLIALATSLSAAGVSFLALLTAGLRVMNFFGVFAFLLLLVTFLFTFSYYIAVIAAWARGWEEGVDATETDVSSSSRLDGETSATEVLEGTGADYPHRGVLDFLKHRPVFGVDGALLDRINYNRWERFVYNYASPVIYLYRLPIVLVFLVWAGLFAYFTFKMGTKSELKFLGDYDAMQRVYTLCLNGFSTALNDFSFVYVWGLDPSPKVRFKDRLTVTDYGSPTYWDVNITDARVQEHIDWTWRHILSQSFIDVQNTANFGVNPWDMWRQIEQLTNGSVFWDLIDVLLEDELDLPPVPSGPPITEAQWATYGLVFQLLLSALAYQEPDSYVPGTLKANTIGFSLDDYGLRYIGMKANMFIPSDLSVRSMRELYDKCTKLEADIQAHARGLGLHGFEGWFTGVAWLTMVTEEELPREVIKDVGLAVGFVAVVILASSWSIFYTFFVAFSMVSTIFLTLGTLQLSGWKIGCNEAIMIAISAGFCADFIVQPMLAMSRDYSARSLFGKVQASLVMFCTPVGSALVTTLVAALFLFPCRILLFPPFGSFLLCSGGYGIIHGFIVLPAWITLLSPNPHKSKPKFELLDDRTAPPAEAGDEIVLPQGQLMTIGDGD